MPAEETFMSDMIVSATCISTKLEDSLKWVGLMRELLPDVSRNDKLFGEPGHDTRDVFP